MLCFHKPVYLCSNFSLLEQSKVFFASYGNAHKLDSLAQSTVSAHTHFSWVYVQSYFHPAHVPCVHAWMNRQRFKNNKFLYLLNSVAFVSTLPLPPSLYLFVCLHTSCLLLSLFSFSLLSVPPSFSLLCNALFFSNQDLYHSRLFRRLNWMRVQV